MLDLTTNSWHTRLYVWTQLSWDRFMFQTHTDSSDHQRTDVCRYIRALLIKLPLLLFLYGALAYYFVYVLFIYPIEAAGTTSYLTFILWAIIISATLIALVFALMLVGRLIGKVEDRNARVRDQIRAGERSPTVWMMIKQWIKDKHDNICTTIRIKN